MQNHVIIVAGGKGRRMSHYTRPPVGQHSELPKQFSLLLGKPLLLYALEAFFLFDSSANIIVVLPEGQLSYWKSLCESREIKIVHKVVTGGIERFMSVKNGLSAIDTAKGIVAVHDGVRPLVSQTTIARCFRTARDKGCAVPVVPVNESLRKVDDYSSLSVNRSGYRIVQTPQCFRLNIIKKAYSQSYQELFTDDAAVVQKAGFEITLVEGNPENIKITTPSDMKLAEAFLPNINQK